MKKGNSEILNLATPIEKLSKSHKRIANYIMSSLDSIPYSTEEDIARQTGVSTATVSRFWRAAGYENMKAFKRYLLEMQQATPANKMQHILEQVGEEHYFNSMVSMVIHHLEESVKRLSVQAFEQAVHRLHGAGKVYIQGAGSSAALTELLRFRLNRIGVSAELLASSGHELYEKLVHVAASDVVVLFTFVQSSPEARVILDHAKEAGYATILITDLFVSEMIEQSEITLQVDRGDMSGFHSMVSPVALIDSLAVALAAQRGAAAMDQLDQLHAIRKKYAGIIPRS